VFGDRHGERVKLFGGGVIDAFLHHAATVLVAGNQSTLGLHRVVDELFVLVAPDFVMKHLLDNMIAVDFAR
jgi:hypothetical protein